MERLAKAGPAVASALLLLLAFPPFNLGLLALVALVPWLGQLMAANGRTGARTGYAFGVVYGLGQLWFIFHLVERWTGNFALALLPWLAATALFALYFALAGWLMARCFQADRPWLAPLVWAGVEVFRSYIPVFAFPWGLTATPLWLLPALNQSAYYGTIYLVSAGCVLASLVLAMILEGTTFIRLRPYFAAVGVLLALSMLRLIQEPETKKMVVTVGQPAVDLAFGDPSTEFARLREAIEPIQDSAVLNGSELLVLPEGVADDPGDMARVPFRPDSAVPILFGGHRSSRPTYQSVFAYEKGKLSHADKTRLVIFGEFVPLRDVLPYPAAFRLPGGDISASAEGVRALDVAGRRIGPLICFEGLFPDLAYRQAQNGAGMLAVVSIDDWYMGSNAPDQTRAASIWRSIETGLPLARSASMGSTLATDHHGRVVAEAPYGVRRALRVEMALPQGPSTFRLLPLFPVLSVLAALVALFPVRKRTEPEAPSKPKKGRNRKGGRTPG